MDALDWFIAANATVLLVSTTIAGVLFWRLQRHRRFQSMLRELTTRE